MGRKSTENGHRDDTVVYLFHKRYAVRQGDCYMEYNIQVLLL